MINKATYQGFGIEISSFNEMNVGFWIKNKLQGHAIEYFNSYGFYIGEVRNHKFNGFGTRT